MNQIGWGYTGTGLCARCERPNHLFVSSESSSGSKKCLSCHYRDIEVAPDEERGLLESLFPNENTFKIIATSEACEACEEPFLDGDGNFTKRTEAFLKDGRTIIVHSECCDSWICSECKVNWASLKRRPYRQNGCYHRPYRHETYNFAVQHTVDGRSFCEDCRDTYIEENGGWDMFFECNHCNEDYHQDNFHGFGDYSYCEECYSNNVYSCEYCDTRYWSDDGHECYEESEYVYNYSYKPSPFFFGEGRFHLGFELEIELQRGNRQDVASMVHDSLGARAYMKEDGSLNNGLEIVTHPHTLEAYREFDWSVLKKLKSYRCRSWNTDTCGLHVHVSRSGFGIKYDREKFDSRDSYLSAVQLSKQAHEFRFMKLIYDNQRQIVRLAGRSTHYASFDDKGKIIDKVKFYHQSNGRYSAVNCENENTLEVRVFRGSLRKERVLSALELVHASVEYTRNLKVNIKDNNLSWLKFAGFVSANVETYPNLALIMNETFSTDNPIDDDVR